MIQAKVIADSKNEFGNRITTMVVTMPRFILAEFNTHRMLSKNSASSRAIPFEKMVKSVEENPFIPIAWQKDHKGMQGVEYIENPVAVEIRNKQWLRASENAIEQAKLLSREIESYGATSSYSVATLDTKMQDCEGVTKQLINRLLEPFMYHTVLVTGTEWENFFALRCPTYQPVANTTETFRSKKDAKKRFASELDGVNWLMVNKGQAEIHMMALAEAMYDALNESTPKQLKAGEWHIPFGDDIDEAKLDDALKGIYDIRKDGFWNISDAKIKIATARCARVSYTVVGEEGKAANYENDIKLHDRLATSGHWSPFEHCAVAMNETFMEDSEKWSGNFKGFIQYRKTFQGENKTVN